MAKNCDAELLSLYNRNIRPQYYSRKERSRKERRFIRKLKVDNVENDWQRFTLFPNVHGQKVRLWWIIF